MPALPVVAAGAGPTGLMCALASDSVRAREYLLDSSMISGLRRSTQVR
jgi:predicted flavoprotein YhiN